ncbi:hypothetical protein WVI01_00750 [Weissella viridescens]|uniref:Uncharacterized protein n=1 Tax=Weissella viridescens TaxID=1629 RepID=A0A0R2H346_WEIVI|nr:hypothetical protein [Weissella viridescens]KRN46811.1 hypothetical protein IV50_GL000074 [Weissella viridescens]MCB6839602.1 hypothetical protein [Weissella viridescens]MCB6846333.1 hypothetical protein [Weissella viridescens]WJI91871.1 hypothetical protein PWA48_03870 [Weissella viridescens]SUP58826.1 Uncharacterised protein [Weissella viridescens]
MLKIIIAILLLIVCILGILYVRLRQKYQALVETSKLRESILDNKAVHLTNISASMENNKTLLIKERERIDQEIIALSNKDKAAAEDVVEVEILEPQTIK